MGGPKVAPSLHLVIHFWVLLGFYVGIRDTLGFSGILWSSIAHLWFCSIRRQAIYDDHSHIVFTHLTYHHQNCHTYIVDTTQVRSCTMYIAQRYRGITSSSQR